MISTNSVRWWETTCDDENGFNDLFYLAWEWTDGTFTPYVCIHADMVRTGSMVRDFSHAIQVWSGMLMGNLDRDGHDIHFWTDQIRKRN